MATAKSTRFAAAAALLLLSWMPASAQELYTVDPAAIDHVQTGYSYSRAAFPTWERFTVPAAAGWNESRTTNEGRTGIPRHLLEIEHQGQGDASGFTIICRVSGAPRGTPMANPACVLLNGQAEAANDGVYLNPVEIHLHHNRRRNVSSAGIVLVDEIDGERDPGSSAFRWGLRVQNAGPYPGDAATTVGGRYRIGVDLTGMDAGEERAAIALGQEQRIYWTAQPGESWSHPAVLGDTWTGYLAPQGVLTTTVQGVSLLYLGKGWAGIDGALQVGGPLLTDGDVYLGGLGEWSSKGQGTGLCIDDNDRVYRARNGRC